MVGDGISDTPNLAFAKAEMAIGEGGASASSQGADSVILVDRFDCVPETVQIGEYAPSITLPGILAGVAISGANKLCRTGRFDSPLFQDETQLAQAPGTGSTAEISFVLATGTKAHLLQRGRCVTIHIGIRRAIPEGRR